MVHKKVIISIKELYIMKNADSIIISDTKLSNQINDLVSNSSKLKKSLFDAIILKKGIDDYELSKFTSYVEKILKDWSSDANSIKDAIKLVKVDNCNIGMDVLDYNYIKEFIYGNYDYASVLQFTDGLLKGIEEGGMSNPQDIEDFKDHTVSMAFNNLTPSVAGLLDSVLSEERNLMIKKANELDIKNFEIIQTYNDLFKYRDNPELCRSISKTIDYISNKEITLPELGYDNTRLYISFIATVVEYITYSIAVYVVRIFMIGKYAEPFIMCEHHDESITESVNNKFDLNSLSENPNGEVSSILRNISELTVKDFNKIENLKLTLNEFLAHIDMKPISHKGNGEYDGIYDVRNAIKKEFKTNEFHKKLCNNVFYDFFIDFKGNNYCDSSPEFYQKIRFFMYNDHNGLPGSLSPKNELLAMINDANYGVSISDYQKLARDICAVMIHLSIEIYCIYTDLCNRLDNMINKNTLYTTLGERKSYSESIKFIEELYEELMFIFIQKLSYIERTINKMRSGTIKNSIDITSLNIPGLETDSSFKHSMMMSYPDTSATHLTESVDMYALPIFESYEIFDEYLRTLPEFSNDLYLNEAEDIKVTANNGIKVDKKDKLVEVTSDSISKIINKIRAILDALWKRIQNFWNGKSFGMVKKWVIDNEETLKGLKFTPETKLTILPYKDEITLPSGFFNLPNNLRKFDEKVVESGDSLQKYLRTLYPSDQIAQWFASGNEDVAAQRYMNLILFDDGSENPRDLVSITGEDIQKKLVVWISTIKESDETLNAFKRISDSIISSIGSVNSKIVNITNKQKHPTGQSQSVDGASTNAALASKDTNDNIQSGGSNSLSILSDASTRITVAITRLWSPIAPITIKAMINQYKYIKSAYEMSSGTSGKVVNTSAEPTGQL